MIGHGNLFDTTMQLLKAAGVLVYSCNTKTANCDVSTEKHLSEADAIVVADYPISQKQLIGSKGVVLISDIVDLNPNVKLYIFRETLRKDH